MPREKGKNTMRKNILAAMLLLTLAALPFSAFAEEMDADLMERWLAQFCQALPTVQMLGDPQQTTDPVRPGEYLLEYEFGTVTATASSEIGPEDVIRIDVRTQQVTDCLGMRVGMPLDTVLSGTVVEPSNTQLYVLSTQEAGLGFSWAYLGEGGVYGVEYITYGDDGTSMKEYTLTYVIDDEQRVSAIRIRCAPTTPAQAQQAMDTAEEIARRQRGALYAQRNDAAVMDADDLKLMGVAVLGVQVSDLIRLLGEPVEIQTLPANGGRLLLYEGATIELMLNEQTGEEVVCGVSASASDVVGPRGLLVGMGVREAAALFACDQDVFEAGGVLYARGVAMGHAPYAELAKSDLSGEAELRYVAESDRVGTVLLEIGVQDAMVRNWHFYAEREAMRRGE